MRKRYESYHVFICSFILSTFILAIFCYFGTHASAEGRSPDCAWVLKISGGAAVLNDSGHGWREIHEGDEISPASPIRVGTGGDLDLQSNNCLMRLGASTHAVYFPAKIALTRGSLRIENTRVAKSSIRCETLAGNVEMRVGTTLVRADDEHSIVSVVFGETAIVHPKDHALFQVAVGNTIEFTRNSYRLVPVDSSTTEKPADNLLSAENRRGIGTLLLRDTRGVETAALEVQEFRAHVQINGPIAMTEIEETFFNPQNFRAEGTFYFPVPPGASLCRLAMYVDGQLVEGEMVERSRARTVYENIVRKMQDPALMEWQDGNVFKTRIFPISPCGLKRILVSYSEVLPSIAGKRNYTLPLCDGTSERTTIGKFAFDADISDVSNSSAVRVPGYSEADIATDNSNTHVHLSKQFFRPGQNIMLQFVHPKKSPLELVTHRFDGEDGYFLLTYNPAEQVNDDPPKPRDIVLLFDTSVSRCGPNYQAQLTLAKTLIHELRQDDQFAVIRFDTLAQALNENFVSGVAAETQTLASLNAIVPLGAANMETALNELERFLQKNATSTQTEVILISDGNPILRERSADKLKAKAAEIIKSHSARFHAVAVGARCNHLLLRSLAEQSHGLYHAILPRNNVSQEAFRFVLDLESPQSPHAGIQCSGGEVYGIHPVQTTGNEVLISGRYKRPGPCGIHIGKTTAEFTLPKESSDAPEISRLWAQKSLETLMLSPQTPEVIAQIVDLSQQYSIMSPYTSFLVLENEAAYQQYGIDRSKRRKELLETGKLFSAPPMNVQLLKLVPIADNPVAPLRIANMDLFCLHQRIKSGRALTTALSALSQEIYYRYMPLSSDAGNEISIPATVFGDVSFADRPTWDQSIDAAQAISAPQPQVDFLPQGKGGEASPGDGGGWSGGKGVGIGCGWIPRGMYAGRYGSDRRRYVVRHGGSRATEDAVGNALHWLADNQNVDGNFENDVESTSFALLAFLGAGHSQKFGEFKENVKCAVNWLEKRQNESGLIGNDNYEHAIAATALSEAAGMANIKATRELAQKAMDYLIAAQHPDGGWAEHTGGRRSVPFITISAIMAMKSAKVAGLHVNPSAFDNVIRYLDTIQERRQLPYDFGEIQVVKQDGEPDGGKLDLLNTSGALWARQLLGWQRDELAPTAALVAQKFMSADPSACDSLYIRYFGTLAMFQQGGELWRQWNTSSRAHLIKRQWKHGPDVGLYDPEGIFIRGRTPVGAFIPSYLAPNYIRAAVESFMAHRDESGYLMLADALAATNDLEVLKQFVEDPPVASVEIKNNIRALALVRMGLVLEQKEKFAQAADTYKAAYDLAECPENILIYHLVALRQAGKTKEALATALHELAAGRDTVAIQQSIAELLMETKNDLPDPVAYLCEKLKSAPSRGAIYVRAALAAIVRHDDVLAARFYELGYLEIGRPENMVPAYVNALMKAAEFTKAAAELECVIARGYHEHWAFETLADVYRKLNRPHAEVARAESSGLALKQNEPK